MCSKKFTEKQLLKGLNPHSAHRDLLSKSSAKPDWISFADGESASGDFMTNRVDVFDEPSSSFVNTDIFLSELKLALDSLPDGDIELCDLANEIGRVIASLNSPHKTSLRETIHGIEHGFDLASKEKGALNE
ncbi:hypothetical protein BA894_11415 [Vibrio natriegens]|uniref:hypothetical protein n=1 Tax=Vibrio natriegens TaxID=691 RepID=UPI000803D3F4|nr:hypothetical protein [Vibrio natriegens]ANQ27025.1 hypothetical protein BA894_11415 [Vibrio natriegens]